MGIFFNRDEHVIGDTQLMTHYLNSVSINDLAVKEKAIKIGQSLGASISRILLLAKHKLKTTAVDGIVDFAVGYMDCNSNTDSAPFLYPDNKGLSLLLLHMLGLLGTCKYVIRLFLGDRNNWGYRCEYIVYHNIWRGLKAINGHFEQIKSSKIDLKSLSELIDSGRDYFPSSYRNCMMHYNLTYDGEACIKETFYKPDISLYGLVESCFDGKPAGDYYLDLRRYMDKVEAYLNTWFSFDSTKILWDLQE